MKPTPAAANARLFPVWLLRSKVSPTRQRVDLLERRSHLLKLQQALDATLSLVHAPAGYGKSTVLSNWREMLLDEGHTVCWLSLGREDNDPMQLLTYLAFALSEGGVDLQRSGIELSHQFTELSQRDFLSIVIHIIAEHDKRLVLMLDDFENLESEVVNEVITPLLEYAPENLHIAIATRDESLLKISNLEAKGQACRFGANQLKFTPLELNEFLAEEYDSHTIAQIYRITEGWPVAVQMIRGAIRVDGDIERILANITGDATHIAAYLSEEVLSNLDAGLQAFLMDISLLDRVDCAFADYLRDDDSSLSRFGAARALDNLVLPVDNVEATFRLHPLFREHLYDKLVSTQPGRCRELHLRAAHWFARNEDLVEAVRHCVLAGQPEQAIPIIVQAGGVMIWFREGLKRLRAIMRLFDEETVLAHWELGMIRCLLDIKDGNLRQARELFDDIVARSEEIPLLNPGSGPQPVLHGDPGLMREEALMGTVLSIYEGKQISLSFCSELEKQVMLLVKEDEGAAVGQYCTILCIAYLQAGYFPQARKFAEMAIPAFESAGSVYGVAYIYFHLGDISFAEGDSVEAARNYQLGLDLTKKHFGDDQGMKLVANILIAELKYELNEELQLASYARSIPRLLEKHEAWFDVYAAGYTTSAHREFDEHGLDAALVIVDRAGQYASRHELSRLQRLLIFLRIDLLLRAGRVAEARAVMEDAGIEIDQYTVEQDSQVAWRERDTGVQAITRLLIREGRQLEALRWLNHFSVQARADGDVRACMKYEILQTIACHKSQQSYIMLEHLAVALKYFAKSRFIRAFMEEADDLLPVLELALECYTDEPQRQVVQSIVQQLKGLTQDAAADPLLSQRELEVLGELVHGYSNKVIARQMGVTESTVRFHLRNIFVKLQVQSRLRAVAVARQKGIV